MFAETPIYEVDGEFVFGLRRESVLPDSSDVLYTVPQMLENKIWLVSELFYDIPDLWWVIASVNNINDPLILPYGTQLRIPTQVRLANEGILTN